MWQAVLTLICAVCVVAGAVDSPPTTLTNGSKYSGRIVGGSAASIEQFPWQVSLTYYQSHRCGGSIISQKAVLSAAHCTYRTIRSAIGVRAGSSMRNSGGVQIRAMDVVEYPGYKMDSNDFDISVIILSRMLPLGSTIQPIAMADSRSVLTPGTSVHISGWGDTSEMISSAPRFLHAVSVPIVDAHVCSAAYAKRANINSNMLCAGLNGIGGRDACQGDSGGPLVMGRTLYGVVSFGIGCARPNYPGVYSKVAAYRTWIDDVMRRY